MKTKRFYALSFVLLFLFAAFTAGGCGGSNSDPVTNEETSAAELPDMNTIMDTDEFKVAFDEAAEELKAEGIDVETFVGPDVHFVFMFGDRAYIDNELDSDDTATASHVKSSALPEEEITRIAEKLGPAYESGDVIALYWPSPDTINDLYKALGEQPSYFDALSESSASSDTYPEMFAIAKRYGTTSTHYFSYEVPGSKAILMNMMIDVLSGDSENVSDDNEGADDPDEGDNSDIISDLLSRDVNLRQEYLFQARRYAAFLKWVALLDKRAAELDAQSDTVQASFGFSAAETTSGNFISFNSQNLDKDTSYYYAGYLPWNQERYRHDINYQSGASYTIFSCHNFSDGDDYYLVKANGFSTPKNVWKGTNGGWENCNFGHTAIYTMDTTIDGATTSDAYLMSNAPRSVNYSGTETDGVSQTIGGKVGANAGAGDKGPSAGVNTELSMSVTYNHSKTWSTNEWRLNNESGTINAKWTADFARSDGKYLANYDNGNVAGASKVRVDLDAEWIWRVRKNYWQKHSTIPLKLAATTWTGFTLWEYHWYKSNENEGWRYGVTQYRHMNMNRPPHVYVTQKEFNVGPEGGTDTFKMLCNNDYTITSNKSWCQISSGQRSGSDTGADERSIWFAVDPYSDNSSAFATREAIITVKETSTGDTQEIKIIQRNR